MQLRSMVNDATVKWTTLYFSSTVYASQKQKALNIIKIQLRYEIENVWKFKWKGKVTLIN